MQPRERHIRVVVPAYSSATLHSLASMASYDIGLDYCSCKRPGTGVAKSRFENVDDKLSGSTQARS